jgi:hypothetical protein
VGDLLFSGMAGSQAGLFPEICGPDFRIMLRGYRGGLLHTYPLAGTDAALENTPVKPFVLVRVEKKPLNRFICENTPNLSPI